MKTKPISRHLFVFITVALALGSQVGFAQSLENGQDAEPLHAEEPTVELAQPTQVYAHLFGGMGMSFLSAGDVKSVIGSVIGRTFLVSTPVCHPPESSPWAWG